MHPGRLAWVRFKRGVLGTGGRYRRGLGVEEGGERVFLLMEKANAQNNGCLLLGPTTQRKNGKVLVSGFLVAGFPAVSRLGTAKAVR